MAKRKSRPDQGTEASATRGCKYMDHLALKDRIAFGMVLAYALQKVAALEPESLSVTLTVALMKLAESDRKTYDGLGGQIVWNTLKESGFLEVLAELKQKAAAGDGQGAVEVAERIDIWVKGIESLAAGGPVQALIDAQEASDKPSKTFVM